MTTDTLSRNYVDLGARALITIAFVSAGLAKLAGAEMMVQTFDAIGVGQWFRYVTGIIEVGSAIALWVPGLQGIAAAVLTATMVGALVAHAFVLGMATGVPAIVLGLLAAYVTYSHRNDLPIVG